jgi:alpha-beta hydrolase superfamily lysophospholipase
MALAHYGDRFAKAGFATFIFDYRTFGGSEGEPRHWASPSRHLDDFVSAVQYIKAELGDVVDVNRVNLWGTSFAGGHVLTLAGSRLRDDITSVVAQVCARGVWTYRVKARKSSAFTGGVETVVCMCVGV